MSERVPRAVITGIGLVTPVGLTAGDLFDAVVAGRSGLVRPPADHPAADAMDVVGLAPAIDPRTVLPRTEARFADRFLVLALTAAAEAIADSGLDVGANADPERVAPLDEHGGVDLDERPVHAAEVLQPQAPRRRGPDRGCGPGSPRCR